MLINRMNKRLLLNPILIAVLSLSFSAPVFAQANVDQVTQEGEKRADAGAAEQQRVEQIANQTDDLLNESVESFLRPIASTFRMIEKNGIEELSADMA